MNTIIEEIIRAKPHLTDPLRFYEKTLGFMDAVRALVGPTRPGLIAYPAETIPPILDRLASLLDLPEGTLSPLKQALELGEIDFTRLPLREVPSFSLPYAEDDLTMLLFLLSRPFFFSLRGAFRNDDGFREAGTCSVCNAQPSLSVLAPDGRRFLFCSFCGSIGSGFRAPCPVCLTRDQSRQTVFTFTGEEGFSVQTCDACGAYVKTVDKTLLERVTPDIADLMSLPLDTVIQRKGYARRSPNPLGMVRMSA